MVRGGAILKNVPNILSSFRICLVPVFVIVYFSESAHSKLFAVLIYALASFTDFLDGFLARKYHIITNAGKVLDPLGDKLMTVAVLVSITVDGVIPVWVVSAAVAKEALMGLGGLIVHRRGSGEIPPSNIIGKSSTVVFFLVCAALMLFDGIGRQLAVILISVAVALMLAAFVSYMITFAKIVREPAQEQ